MDIVRLQCHKWYVGVRGGKLEVKFRVEK
jgi:hypothetical protein